MNRICVFAGSNFGTNEAYRRGASRLGQVLAQHKIDLVYGGSSSGLMGAVADAVLAHGGQVIGVMPTGLFGKEIVHLGLSRFIEVNDMHERKATMNKLCDGFIAVPGGFGTYEELFEVISWAQIGLHQKPIGLLNIEGYYNPLLDMVEHTVKAGFVRELNPDRLLSDGDPSTLVSRMLTGSTR